eukprot:scaffold42063_cov63-Phaeocystis_antarctica.AAC.3
MSIPAGAPALLPRRPCCPACACCCGVGSSGMGGEGESPVGGCSLCMPPPSNSADRPTCSLGTSGVLVGSSKLSLHIGQFEDPQVCASETTGAPLHIRLGFSKLQPKSWPPSPIASARDGASSTRLFTLPTTFLTKPCISAGRAAAGRSRGASASPSHSTSPKEGLQALSNNSAYVRPGVIVLVSTPSRSHTSLPLSSLERAAPSSGKRQIAHSLSETGTIYASITSPGWAQVNVLDVCARAVQCMCSWGHAHEERTVYQPFLPGNSQGRGQQSGMRWWVWVGGTQSAAHAERGLGSSGVVGASDGDGATHLLRCIRPVQATALVRLELDIVCEDALFPTKGVHERLERSGLSALEQHLVAVHCDHLEVDLGAPSLIRHAEPQHCCACARLRVAPRAGTPSLRKGLFRNTTRRRDNT